jgi:hypothetical protein
VRREDWTVNFLVRLGGRVIGNQALTGLDFARIREVSTGSWIGPRHQGQDWAPRCARPC